MYYRSRSISKLWIEVWTANKTVAIVQGSNFYEAALNYHPAVNYEDETRVSIGAMTKGDKKNLKYEWKYKITKP